MSVAGRNRTRGAQCAVYRPVETSVAGSLERDWGEDNPVLDARIELLPMSETTRREIFGTESLAELSAMVPASFDIRPKDGIGVTSGPYAGRRFIVEARRALFGYAELALVSTTEWFPNPPDTLPEGVEP
jgi:hypothetical protein